MFGKFETCMQGNKTNAPITKTNYVRHDDLSYAQDSSCNSLLVSSEITERKGAGQTSPSARKPS